MNWKTLPYLSQEGINEFIELALKEDVGDGDHTSLASIPPGANEMARLLCKDDGVVAGVDLAEMIFKKLDPRLSVQILKKDGSRMSKGEVIFLVDGPAASILTGERLVLNCMQRMSAIATYTHNLNRLINHTKARLLDTRKTTPGFRMMEKWAVAIGGGVNHRFGLFDMILLKDNHIDFCGGITKAIRATRAYLKEQGKDLRIEIETRSINEVKEVLDEGGVHRILLDNMKPEMLIEAVGLIKGRFETEASGGITETNIKSVAETGVDYISVGALTHSYKSLDLSLKAVGS